MFVVRKPTEAFIRQFLARQSTLPFSYDELGMARESSPTGYAEDHNRVMLGTGQELFGRAVEELRCWRMFDIGWAQLCFPDAPIVVGTTVAVLAALPGCWSLNACRIAYLIESDGPVRRYGFGYGTLPDHIERGEETFMIEWHHADDSVWYDIHALSRPRHVLAKLGYPVARLMQKRFARDSKRTMLRAVTR